MKVRSFSPALRSFWCRFQACKGGKLFNVTPHIDTGVNVENLQNIDILALKRAGVNVQEKVHSAASAWFTVSTQVSFTSLQSFVKFSLERLNS